MIKVAILTISDSCSQQEREDVSGETIKDMLGDDKFEICEYKIVPDEHGSIKEALIYFADEVKADIVLTTGGTGFGPRDITPEATTDVCYKMVPGFSELMRSEGLKKTKKAVLSRGVSGIRENTLIINLPGSPKAVRESLEAILDVLGHAVKMVHGGGH
ncbi:MAG: molybdenum cofactor biosynthesis protein [Phycisphaerae bacterium]|nr:MogA/MoaB family molybdenum cofactor biosynthesis protein [Phycisphaerae bacterium]NIP55244.1 MogA/MoaB family molybdenum cofactor biosynthesis protein [Phycisphaerae bacterium]NIS53917.1 MogA/MoaB family molybdenum cofactor biosynthesis protein [Phycisphaerae bacterium]NIU11525.1 MogA/MoaB family molybdenum cofactor biosynthesis protein [Phycisphaerae bacterium]NIU59317.1 molybdenum cofactor biosynthesis protein [Phycisphaerae bacterium]